VFEVKSGQTRVLSEQHESAEESHREFVLGSVACFLWGIVLLGCAFSSAITNWCRFEELKEDKEKEIMDGDVR